MAKVKVGTIEIEIGEASLYTAERVAEIEARCEKALKDSKGRDAAAAYIDALLVLAGDANPGLDVEKIERALPFFGLIAACQRAYRDALIASGIIVPGGEPGEAPRP